MPPGNAGANAAQLKPQRVLRELEEQRDHAARARETSWWWKSTGKDRPRKFRLVSEQIADVVHPRGLRDRRESTHLRNGQVRPTRFYCFAHANLDLTLPYVCVERYCPILGQNVCCFSFASKWREICTTVTVSVNLFKALAVTYKCSNSS